MAENHRSMPVPPEHVWAVLAHAETYAQWIVGAKDIRAADPSWPAAGATFHHTQGRWPLEVKDTTTVIDAVPLRRLLLEVRARPLVIGSVDIMLQPREAGTHVTMVENTTGGLAARLPRPLADLLVKLRNRPTLARLEELARERGPELALRSDAGSMAPRARA